MATNYDLQQTGEQVQQILNSAPEMEERTKDTTVININAMADSEDTYTLETAIAALGAYEEENNVTYRKSGLVLTYKTDDDTWESKQFLGEVEDFEDETLWDDFGSGGQPAGDYATRTELAEGLATKQNTINDLDAIRSGAGKGATSVQGVKMEGDDEPLIPDGDGVVTIPQPEIPDSVTSVIDNHELVFQTPDGQSVKGKVGITTGADGLLHLTLTDEEGNTYSSPIAGLRVNGNALQYSNDGEIWVTVQTFGNLTIKYVQASDPASGDVGDLALVGSTNAYVLKVYVGGSWVSVCDFGTLDLTSDGITMAGENKTLTEKMSEIDELQNKMLYSNLLTEVTTGTRSTSYITVSYDSENDATTFHCVAATGGYRAWINLPSGLVVGRQYKVVFDYTTNSTATVYVKISTNAGNQDITTAAATTFTKGSGHKEILFTMASGIVHINIASLDIGAGKDVVLSHVKVYDMSDVYSLREVKDKIDNIHDDIADKTTVVEREEVILGAASNYNMAATNWYATGKHVAIPVADLGGAGAIIAVSMNMYDYVAFVSSYTKPTGASAINFVDDVIDVKNDEGITSFPKGRLVIWQFASKGYHYMTIPASASHFVVNTIAGNGTATGVKVYKVSETPVTEMLGDVCDNIKNIDATLDDLQGASVIGDEVSLDNPSYSGNDYNMASTNWFYKSSTPRGHHVAVPVGSTEGSIAAVGEVVCVRCLSHGSEVGFLKSSYTLPTGQTAIPFASQASTMRYGENEVTFTGRRWIGTDYGYTFLTVPSDAAYLCLNTRNGDGIFAGFELYQLNQMGIVSAVSYIDAKVKELSDENSGKGSGILYVGDKISLDTRKHYAKVTRLFNTPSGQATWYYNGYFFNCQLSQKDNNVVSVVSKFRLYQPNGTTLGNPVAEWDMESVVGIGYYSDNSGVHANSIQLLNFKYVDTDEFPIFTITHHKVKNGNTSLDKMFVMRLYSENGSWNLVKLYDVIFQGDDTSYTFGGEILSNLHRLNILAFEDGTIYAIVGNSYLNPGGYVYLEIYDKTKRITRDRTSDLVITPSDRVRNIVTGYEMLTMMQATFHYGNKLYQLDGDSWSYSPNSSDPNRVRNLPHLLVFDLDTETCVNDILLNETFGIPDAEPEGICIVDGKMYISQNGENNNGYMYELEFD